MFILSRLDLTMAKVTMSNQLANVCGLEGETILVIGYLITHVCGESRRKHGADIRITALRGKRIISY